MGDPTRPDQATDRAMPFRGHRQWPFRAGRAGSPMKMGSYRGSALCRSRFIGDPRRGEGGRAIESAGRAGSPMRMDSYKAERARR